MAALSSSREWADLHGDVLTEISKFLNSRVEKLHMRAVCTSWRFYCPLPPKNSPYLVLPFPIVPLPTDSNRNAYYVLTESTLYGFQPLKKILNSWDTAKTWIVKFEDNCSGKEPGKAKFKDPLYHLPVFNTESWPKVLNSLDYRVTEIGKDYEASFFESGEGEPPSIEQYDCCLVKDFAVSKPFCGSNEGLVVMALSNERELAVWRTGEKKWRVVKGREGPCYIHVAFHNGLFYAVEFDGSTITVDPVSLNLTPLVTATINPYQTNHCESMYLSKSFGDIFLIHKYGIGADDFLHPEYDDDDDVMYPFKLKVYKLDEGKKEWVPVKELKDRVLFVSDYTCSFSLNLMTKDFAGLRGNCVVYLHHYIFYDDGSPPGFYAGVFDLEEDVTWKVREEPNFSKIFWPPPAWIKKESTTPKN